MQSTTITLNVKKNLIKLHLARRRARVIGLLKEAAARFTKTDIEEIKIHKDLNEYLEKNTGRWTRLKVSVEKSEGKVELKPYVAKAESVASKSAASKPEAKEKQADTKEKQQKKA